MILPFYVPVRLFWGQNCLKETDYPFSELGNKACIVTGRHSAEKSGALADMIAVLKRNKVQYVHFSDVTENPEISTVQKAVDIFNKEHCNFIIGIGGGSPIDAAKAVAVAAYNKISAEDVYNIKAIRGAVSLIAVPLTSGTGTEVTPFSVLSDNVKGKKAGFGHDAMFPLISYCDPLYTMTVPPEVTRDTGLDALSHLMEGIFSVKRNPVTYPLIRQGVSDILDSLIIAVEKGSDLKARSRLMMASLWGGVVIAQSGTTLQHAIGYPLTVRYGISHGRANGLVLSQICDLYSSKISRNLQAVFGADTSLMINRLNTLLNHFNLKAKISIDELSIPAMAKEVLNARNMANNPLSVNQSDIEALYRTLL